MPDRRPADGVLTVWLYGRTADLVRQECKERQMSHDEFVKQVLWAWQVDLVRARRSRRAEPIDERIGDVE